MPRKNGVLRAQSTAKYCSTALVWIDAKFLRWNNKQNSKILISLNPVDTPPPDKNHHDDLLASQF